MRPWARIASLARHAPALADSCSSRSVRCASCRCSRRRESALPPAPVLDVLVAVSAAAWVATVLATARWWPVRAAALLAAAVLVGGRVTELAWVSGAGVVLVLGVVFWIQRAPRRCQAPSRIRSALISE